MAENEFYFDSLQFNKMFPFYVLINKDMKIIDCGNAFSKILPTAINCLFNDLFIVKRPSVEGLSLSTINKVVNQAVVLETKLSLHKIILKGQFEYIELHQQLIFLGSPWISSIDEIKNNNLSLNDFANHDATIDLLHTIKIQENLAYDLKEVLNILNLKKEEQRKEQEKVTRLSLVASLNESGVIFLNAAGKILWSNEGFSKLTGYTANEIAAQYFYKLGNGSLSDENELIKILQELAEGKTIQAEFVYYTKNEELIWCKAKGQSIPNAKEGERQFFMIVEDITLKRKQNERLKVLSLIAEDNINAVIIADANGRIEWANKSFTEMTGFTLDEIKGKKSGEMLQGEASCKETTRYMQTQIQQGKDFTTEVVNYSKSGLPYWVKIQCQPIKDAAGNLAGFFAIEENITEKRLSEQRLQESEKRLASLITNLHAGILVEDENRKIVLANPLFCQMFNISASPDALVGVDCSASAEQSKLLFKQPEEFVATIDFLLLEKKLVTDDVLELTDGRFFSRDFIPIYLDNIYRGHLWKYTDISAEKHAQNALLIREEKYRGIIANMNLGLMEVDNNQIIRFVNKSFCDMCGYPLEELIGFSAPSLFLEAKFLKFFEDKNNIRKTGKSDAYEIKTKNKIGEEKWWFISGAPSYNDAGVMIGTIGIHLDITDQKIMQAQLKAAKEVAEKAHAAEQEFLANMSHEIRTPLNAIAGMTYLLQDTPVNNEQQEYLDVVQSSTEILLRLVTNILDISKIEAGKIDANLKELDIIRLLKGLEKTIRIQHKNSAVKVVFEYPVSPIQFVVSDDLMITQILLNILSNASKFTDKGEIKLQTELYSNNDDKVLLNVKISDTGRGMSKIEQNTIFEKFTQAGDDESRSKGTGLGLAITKKLIQLLNGTIHLESKEGEGTSFNILLPLIKGQSTILVERPEDASKVHYDFKGCKVLVAEDNEVNRKYIGKLLSKWEVAFQFAENGEEAINMLSVPNSFELILMDLQMPIKDGIEATIEIRNSDEWYRNIPIIGVSATAIIGIKQIAKESGINDFVSKPYTPTQLQVAMGQFLSRKLSNNVEVMEIVDKDGKFVFNEMLNIKHLDELLDGDYEYAKVLFEIFETTIVPQIDDLKELYNKNDCAAFKTLVHKIKPTFSMVGIPGFDVLLNKIEKQAGTINNLELLKDDFYTFLDKISPFIPVMHQEIERLVKYLESKK